MIPLTMVTGFLGAGKTTLLRHVARTYADSRIVYLVNEFSPQDMDGIQLQQHAGAVLSVPGGSIFCRCVAGQFIEHLTDIPKRYHHPGQPVRGVVIEASGVADPRVAARMLSESRLDKLYEIRRIVCVIDPGSIHKLLKTLPNMTAQIESADTVLINKTDRFADEEISRTEHTVAELAPDARIVRTTYCNVQLELFEPSSQSVAADGEYAVCRDPNYEHLLVECTRPVSEQWLQARLEEYRADIYRAKGLFIGGDHETKWLDHTAAGTTIEPGNERVSADEPPRVTFILRAETGDHIKPVAEQLGRVVVHA